MGCMWFVWFKYLQPITFQRHKAVMHTCKECGKLFMTYRSLSLHVGNIHKAILKFICNLCEYKSDKKYSVEDHRGWDHGRMRKRFYCWISGAIFVIIKPTLNSESKGIRKASMRRTLYPTQYWSSQWCSYFQNS